MIEHKSQIKFCWVDKLEKKKKRGLYSEKYGLQYQTILK